MKDNNENDEKENQKISFEQFINDKINNSKDLNTEIKKEDLLNEINEKELLSQRNKQILPELKPVIPKYSSFVKRNGILVKYDLPLRINYGKNHSGII